MQIRNNYDLEVFNGDIGRIAGTDKGSAGIQVDFDQHRVDYEPTDLDELTLAYACSVHKSQGSEYPCVILPVHTQHYILLQRNLLYTAVTRGQRLVVLVGDPRALAVAVSNAKPQERYTRLAHRLAAKT
jgi:exodeoxyribonuclease V alpha subunit